MKLKWAIFVLFSWCALFAVEVFKLPSVSDELKRDAEIFYNNECKACHRWGRKFAAPPMRDNVAQYKNAPEAMVEYLKKPVAKNPDIWPPMDITPLSEENAKMMVAWLLYILENPEDAGRPK